MSEYQDMAVEFRKEIERLYPQLMHVLDSDFEFLRLQCVATDDATPSAMSAHIAQIRQTKDGMRKQILEAWANAELEAKRVYADSIREDLDDIINPYV